MLRSRYYSLEHEIQRRSVSRQMNYKRFCHSYFVDKTIGKGIVLLNDSSFCQSENINHDWAKIINYKLTVYSLKNQSRSVIHPTLKK